MLILHPKVQSLLKKYLILTDDDISRYVLEYHDTIYKSILGTIALHLDKEENAKVESILKSINQSIQNPLKLSETQQLFQRLFDEIKDDRIIFNDIAKVYENINDATNTFIFEALNSEAAKLDLLKVIEDDLTLIERFEKKHPEFYKEETKSVE